MILELAFIALLGAVNLLTFWLPSGLYLPWGLDSLLVMVMGYFYAFVAIFPPLAIVMQAFLIYIGFRLSMLFVKLFLGSRAPIS